MTKEKAAGKGNRRKRSGGPFEPDTPVVHAEWGEGRVIAYEGDAMTVLFDEGGYRTLSVALVLENDSLKTAPPG